MHNDSGRPVHLIRIWRENRRVTTPGSADSRNWGCAHHCGRPAVCFGRQTVGDWCSRIGEIADDELAEVVRRPGCHVRSRGEQHGLPDSHRAEHQPAVPFDGIGFRVKPPWRGAIR